MRIQVASDIHLEAHDHVFSEIIEPVAPYLALVGDVCCLGVGYSVERRFIKFLAQCAKHFAGVFVLTGNHEYYTNIGLTMEEIEERMEEICEMHENVHFLQRQSVVIDDIRIIGATLWSNIPKHFEKSAENTMTDFLKIYSSEGTRLRASKVRQLHLRDLNFIQAEIQEAILNDQQCVVLTHHAPSLRCFWPDGELPDEENIFGLEELAVNVIESLFNYFRGNPALSEDQNKALLVCCCSNLESILRHEEQEKPALTTWIYGHTHIPFDKIIGQTRVVTNPLGYDREPECRKKFRDNFTVDVSEQVHVSKKYDATWI